MISDLWRNKEWNVKIPRIKWKWKYNLPGHLGHKKAVLREKCIVMSAYTKKLEWSKINNLMLQLKILEKNKPN
jgi:hypothetical protein